MCRRNLPLLPMSSDLSKYDNEKYMQNPLLTFRLDDLYEPRRYEAHYQRVAAKIWPCWQRLPEGSVLSKITDMQLIEKMRLEKNWQVPSKRGFVPETFMYKRPKLRQVKQ